MKKTEENASTDSLQVLKQINVCMEIRNNKCDDSIV